MRKPCISTVLLACAFLAGIVLLLYPTVSDWWNSSRMSRAVEGYEQAVEELPREDYERMLSEARAYNEALSRRAASYVQGALEDEGYAALLDPSGTGMMGTVEIAKIGVTLPIYHGTGDAELAAGAGHLEGSSLPVGGEGTHAVITGHRGLPSARLFTDLDQLAEGDTFVLRVLDETLTYEVDQIRIVEPEDVSELGVRAGEDLCTLVTCTPYGINTQRLLVRGHRVANALEASDVPVDATRVDPLAVASVIAAAALAVAFVAVMARTRRRG